MTSMIRYALLPPKVLAKLLLLSVSPISKAIQAKRLEEQVLGWTDSSSKAYTGWRSSVDAEAEISGSKLRLDLQIRASNQCIPMECHVYAEYALPSASDPLDLLNHCEQMTVSDVKIDGRDVYLCPRKEAVQQSLGKFCRRHAARFFILYDDFVLSRAPAALHKHFKLNLHKAEHPEFPQGFGAAFWIREKKILDQKQ